jgi:hypothetical protein
MDSARFARLDDKAGPQTGTGADKVVMNCRGGKK